MTTVYFIRHAEPDKTKFDDEFNCPLTPKGQADCARVTGFLHDKAIDIVFSSPYKRTVDTVKPFADYAKLKINIVDEFREWKQALDGWNQEKFMRISSKDIGVIFHTKKARANASLTSKIET